MQIKNSLGACCLALAAYIATGNDVAASTPWSIGVGEDANSGAPIAILSQDSATTIKDEYATKDVVPRLSFQCETGMSEVTARIDWGRFISSFNIELGFKVDDGNRTWLKWGVDRSEKVTISPSSADTAKLVELLGNGSSLEIEISPYSEGPVTAQYDLTAFSDGMEELLTHCN